MQQIENLGFAGPDPFHFRGFGVFRGLFLIPHFGFVPVKHAKERESRKHSFRCQPVEKAAGDAGRKK
jgi:hypothetical protein